MKILHLLNQLNASGNGLVYTTVDMAIEQRLAGHEVVIGAPHGVLVKLLSEYGVAHLPLPQSTAMDALRALPRLSRFIRAEKVDVVNPHMMGGAILARLAALGSRAVVVTTVHNSWQRHAVLMAVGHHIIAISEAVKAEMVARGIPSRKVSVVLNGPIGSQTARFGRAVAPVMLRSPSVLTVASLHPRKGIQDLVLAAKRLRDLVPGVMVYVAGTGKGGQHSRFSKMALDLGLEDTVTFLGFRSDIAALMQQASVFVLPSREEPFGRVISEARAAGLPIIATSVGGIPEALDNGAAGRLVPPASPDLLAEAIAEVLLDPDLNARMRAAAIRGLEYYHVRRVAEDTLKVYEATIAAARS